MFDSTLEVGYFMENQNNNIEVVLNIYDLCQFACPLHYIGLGLYHTGIEIGDEQFIFMANDDEFPGIYSVPPKNNLFPLRESIKLGKTQYQWVQIQTILNELMAEFISNTYDLLRQNCNHFTQKFLDRLFDQNYKFPSRLHRVSSIVNQIRCFFPQQCLNGGFPVNREQKKTGPAQRQTVKSQTERPAYQNQSIQKTIFADETKMSIPLLSFQQKRKKKPTQNIFCSTNVPQNSGDH